MTARWDIEVTRGSSIGPYEISFVDQVTGDPIDLSDYTLAAQIRSSALGAIEVAFTFDTTNEATGVIVAHVPYGDTEELLNTSYVWDCTATNDDGIERLVLWSGTVTVSQGVTR